MLGIYIHVPFCADRCRYCDFATNVYETGAERRYLRSLYGELEAATPHLGRAPVDTVYLGGGTPPVLGTEHLGDVLAAVGDGFAVSPEAEVSCEANPESLSAEIIEAMLERGVNRLSLGVQSFDDPLLRTLGRRHTAATAEEAYWRGRAAGFDNVSLDMMYGLPGQDRPRWHEDVRRLLALKPDHVSIYALTLEPGVRLARERGVRSFPSADEQAEMYYEALEVLHAAGYIHYEISNFARPGRQCRHNLKYWRDEACVGFGPSAASYWGGGRYRNPSPLDEYRDAAATGRWPLGNAEPSDPYREMRTAFVLGLRLVGGVDPVSFTRRTGLDPETYFQNELAELAAAGLVTSEGGKIRLTHRGLFLSDEVFAALI